MEAFVDHWMGLPLFATQGKLPAKVREVNRERRLRNRPEALAACLRGMGTGAQPSFWGALPEIQVPTLLLAGEEDKKFTIVAQSMADLMPRSHLRLIPRAGHTIHLENPFAWLAAVRTFEPSEL
jgi:2-succinyl-6-hydroxy-2,4-cyclohexadiene-1-carboxylate synthase